ncbi:MAG: hypothetical protein IJU37_11125 [Desulfovibrio sp.]|nr:hypothetical protein [Desulfovibrio sp.]
MAMWAMAATAVLTAVSTVMSSEQQRMQRQAQGNAMEAQAQAQRQQAQLMQQKGDMERRQIERQRSQLRREFEQAQGHNRSLLAAGNVDMSSGSAMDVSLGNIERFASEVQENAYEAALKKWETNEQVKMANYQADVYDAQGSYLKSSAGSLGTSLLKGAVAGAMSFGSSYARSLFAGMGAGATQATQGANGAISNSWTTSDLFSVTRHKVTSTPLPLNG